MRNRRLGRHPVLPRRSLAGPLAWLALASVAACSSPAAPTPPVQPPAIPGPPAISCPADLQLQSTDGKGAVVNYQPPTVSDGALPVSLTCSVAQDASLPLGKTTVTCTATDARQRSSSCSFAVNVVPPPMLSGTRFLAFGDSMTWGQISDPVTLALADTPGSYPSVLEVLLSSRYVADTPLVMNAGIPGERATQGALRLPSLVNDLRPDAVLLMEGANDLSFLGEAGIEPAIDALTGMVDDARQRGAQVFLATLPPQRATSPKGYCAHLIPDFNRGVRDAAAAEGARLVDVYAVLATDMDRFIGADGLHPTEAGYQRIAELFLEAIKATLEKPASLPDGGSAALASPFLGK